MSGYFFSLTLTMYPQDNPKPSHNWDAEDTVILKWGNSKKGAARNSSSRGLGDQVLFLSSSGPEGPLSVVCTRLGWAVGGPTWIWRLWACAEGNKHSRSIGQGSLAGTSSPDHQPHVSPSLGTKPAQASGMWQQPQSPRPKGKSRHFLCVICILYQCIDDLQCCKVCLFVFGVQHHDSHIHRHVHLLFRVFFPYSLLYSVDQ